MGLSPRQPRPLAIVPSRRGTRGVTSSTDAAAIAPTAQTIAALLGDDGSCFETEDGKTLQDLLSAALVYGEPNPDPSSSAVRYEFVDGSVIVECGDAWDFEGNEKWKFENE